MTPPEFGKTYPPTGAPGITPPDNRDEPVGRVRAATQGIAHRLTWASMHWGNLHPDAHKHLAAAAIEAADAHDKTRHIQRVPELGEAIVAQVAEAMALEGDEDDCFQVVREYQAMGKQEKVDYNNAHGFPSSELEGCNYWLRKAKAAIAALKPAP